jgi:hypothetical protein
MTNSPRRPAALALSLLLLAAACGSTTHVADGAAPSDGGLAPAPRASSPDAVGDAGAGAPTGAGRAGAPAAAGGGGGRVPSTSLPPAGSVAHGAGGPVEIGFLYVGGQGELGDAVGAANGAIDQRRAYEVLVDDLNARGGLLGRQVEPVFAAIDVTSTQPVESQEQAACATFTEDHRVALAIGLGFETFVTCMGRRGVSVITGDPQDFNTDGFFGRYPHFLAASAASMDRSMVAMLQVLPDAFFVERWDNGSGGCVATTAPRFGVFAVDSPDLRAAFDGAVLPGLRARGIDDVETFWVAVAGSAGEQVSAVASGAQSAVLRFASECVDHVLFLDNATLAAFFMVVADSQSYHPRYALTTHSGPQLIVPNLSDPQRQLHGMLGLGWSPHVDVAPDTFDPATKAMTASCIERLEAGNVTIEDDTQRYFAAWMCSSIAGLEAAAASAGDVTSAAVLTAVDRGIRFDAPATFASAWGQQVHDAAAIGRTLGWDDDCGCIRYSDEVSLR